MFYKEALEKISNFNDESPPDRCVICLNPPYTRQPMLRKRSESSKEQTYEIPLCRDCDHKTNSDDYKEAYYDGCVDVINSSPFLHHLHSDHKKRIIQEIRELMSVFGFNFMEGRKHD